MNTGNYKGIYYIRINGNKYTAEQLKTIFGGDKENGIQCNLQKKSKGNTVLDYI